MRWQLVACLVSGLVGAWLALAWHRLRIRSRARAYNTRGQLGERSAERLLQAHGYRILERQLRTFYQIEVQRMPHVVELLIDFMVERHGEQLVAEVKTGASGPRIERAETRRQLLEYQLATGSRCVLLVDPAAQTISEIRFPLVAAQGRSHALVWRAVLAVLVLLAVLRFWQH
jgi:hypothetical protein